MIFKTGSFSKSGSVTTQNVAHGLGVTPKLVILWTGDQTSTGFESEARFALGFYDGTTHRCIQAQANDGVATDGNAAGLAYILAQSTDTNWSGYAYQATISAWDATNFTINWAINDGNTQTINFIAIAGVSAKVGEFNRPTVASNVAVTGVGFRPDLTLFFTANPVSTPGFLGGINITIGAMNSHGEQWALTQFGPGSDATSDVQRAQRTNRCLYDINNDLSVNYEATFISMDNGGFTINFATVPGSARPIYYMAINGCNTKLGSFNKATGAAPASQAITGVALTPKAEGLLLFSFMDITRASAVAGGRLGMGASDGTTSGAVALHARDAVSTAETDTIGKAKVFVKVDNDTPAVDAEADLTSFDTTGFTLNWTTNDAVATEILYALLADPGERVYASMVG